MTYRIPIPAYSYGKASIRRQFRGALAMPTFRSLWILTLIYCQGCKRP